jgi:hypothetical protein
MRISAWGPGSPRRATISSPDPDRCRLGRQSHRAALTDAVALATRGRTTDIAAARVRHAASGPHRGADRGRPWWRC